MPKKKEQEMEAEPQQGVEDGLLPVLLDEETLRGRMGAISNEMERLRVKILRAYKDLLHREPRAHLAVTFLREDLLQNDEAKAAVLDFKVKSLKPIKEDKAAVVEIELEREKTEYDLLKLELERYDKDFDKLAKQLMWHQTVINNNVRAVPMGSTVDTIYRNRPSVLDEERPPIPGFDTPSSFDRIAAAEEQIRTVEAPQFDLSPLPTPGEAAAAVFNNRTVVEDVQFVMPDDVTPVVPEAQTEKNDPAALSEPESAPEPKLGIDWNEVKANAKRSEPVAVGTLVTEVKSPANPISQGLADMITTKQLGMIRAVAREAGVDADEECSAVMKCQVSELSKRAASALIDHLRDLQEKREADRERDKQTAPGVARKAIYGDKPQTLQELRDEKGEHTRDDETAGQREVKYMQTDGTITDDPGDEPPF